MGLALGGNRRSASHSTELQCRATLRDMKSEPSIFDEIDDVADAAADAEGLADLDAGRVVTHDLMKAWLQSWGTPDELSAPSKAR